VVAPALAAPRIGGLCWGPHNLLIAMEEATCVVDTRSPLSLQPIFRHRNAHKFYQYNQQGKLKNHSVARCVTIHSEDREKIESSTRSNERRQAPGPSVNFKDETCNNGDL
jgi:hypothetical protein